MLFAQLLSELHWRQDEIMIYGKPVTLPRLQALYSDNNLNYAYSGLTMTSRPMNDCLITLKQVIEKSTGYHFNAVLANLYRDGEDCVGWHSDDEAELGVDPVIASLSLGDTRNFQLKHKTNGKKLNIDLTSGSLLIMAGKTQQYWSHCLPRTKRVKSSRINLTFREIISQ